MGRKNAMPDLRYHDFGYQAGSLRRIRRLMQPVPV
jgi:hypothetical protein